MSTLIRSVSSARFRHLTSNHFRIINDPAADYGYFLYENHLIFAEVTNTAGNQFAFREGAIALFGWLDGGGGTLF